MAGIRGTVDFVGYPVGKPGAGAATAGFLGLLDFVGYSVGKPSAGGPATTALAGSTATTGQGQIIYGITSGLFIARSLRRRAAPGYWRRR